MTALILGRMLLVAAGYCLCARLGLLIPYVGTHISLIWLPTGVALAAYLRWGGAMAPAIVAAAFVSNLTIAGPDWVAAGIALGNALGPWLSARLLRRWHFDATLGHWRDRGAYLGAAMLGMLVTASNGTAWLVAGGALSPALWPSAWLSWWIGDWVGALLSGVPLVALSGHSLREAFRSAELLSSQRQFEALFMHAGDGILVVGPDRRLQALNPAACRLLGVVEHAALGQPLLDLPDGHGEALAAWLASWQASGSEHAPHDLLLPRPEGPPLAIELQAARYPDAGGEWHTHLVMHDVSAHRDAEARIAGSERRLRAIADNMPALICSVDLELRFRFVNATYETWFGVAPQAMIGRPVDEFLAPGHQQTRRSNMEQVLRDGERLNFEFMTELKGRTRHLRSTYVPDLSPSGEIQGLYVLTMDVTEQKTIEASLNKLVRFDHLTGLLNRHPFEERLDEAVRGAQRGQGALAVLFIDVDRFKEINDSRGHAAGDAVLQEFARRLQRAVRANDTVARLGGDEFVVLLERVRGPEQAESVAAKVCAEMQAPFELGDGPLVVGASVGVAWCDGAHALSAGRAMAAADAALYESKRSGRNTWRLRRCDEAPLDGTS